MSPKLDEKTQTVDLPRMDDTSNYAKFGVNFNREAKKDIAGTIYVPLDQAVGVTHLKVTLMKGK